MENNRLQIHKQLMGDWTPHLSSAIEIAEKEIYPELTKLKSQKAIYPNGDLIYKAFKSCQWDNLKVVLLGQD